MKKVEQEQGKPMPSNSNLFDYLVNLQRLWLSYVVGYHFSDFLRVPIFLHSDHGSGYRGQWGLGGWPPGQGIQNLAPDTLVRLGQCRFFIRKDWNCEKVGEVGLSQLRYVGRRSLNPGRLLQRQVKSEKIEMLKSNSMIADEDFRTQKKSENNFSPLDNPN